MTIKSKKIYTLGTSNRDEKQFIDILKHYNINAIIDVRRFPTSRWEHFKKEKLQRLVEKESIRYFYLGKKLGGYRKEGYKKYTQSKFFQEGIKKLEKIALQRNSTILCAEKFPWRCHRRFIAKALQDRGWKVTHIIDKKRVWKS